MTRAKATKLFASITCAALAALSLSACSNPIETVQQLISTPTIEEARAAKQTSSQVASTALIKEGVLTVGYETSAGAPFIVNGSDGTTQGYDIDVASALASQLGLEVKFVEVTSPTSEAGSTCDVVMSMTSNHASGLTIVGSYAEDATAFFAKSEGGVITTEDLGGKTVGVQASSTSSQLLKRSNLDVTQNEYNNLNEAFESLNNGEVDYVLCDALSGAYLAGFYEGLSCVGTINAASSIGIAVAESNADLQTAVQDGLSTLNSNGVIDILRSKWLNGLSTLTTDYEISGITISAGSVSGASETATSENVSQDGSNAGANAVDIAG